MSALPFRRRGAGESAPTPPPAPFIVGVGRSGTTLLRLMLDAHPGLTVPPETHFIPSLLEAAGRRGATPGSLAALVAAERRFGDFNLSEAELAARFAALARVDGPAVVRAFYALYAERQGKPRWGDKTPIYVTAMQQIAAALPEARFIHLIRDGRDVAISRIKREMGRSPEVADQARKWRERIERARLHGRRVPHYTELRYEQLVADPEGSLRALCEFIELDYDPAMLAYHERAEERIRSELGRDLPQRDGEGVRASEERVRAHAMTSKPPSDERIGAWRREMDPRDLEAYERVAGDLLADLGYEVGAKV